MKNVTGPRQEREQRLAMLQARLIEAVGELVTSQDWKRALEFAARFRSRSFGNTMLIYAQHEKAFAEGRVPEPTPTYVAGFKQWASLDRHVDKGQTGYAILAPVTGRFASVTPDDRASWRRLAGGEHPVPGEVVRSRMVGVRPAYVWDVSQTSGAPLPDPPRPALLRGEAPAGLWDGLADQVTARGFGMRLVSDASAIGGANGLTNYTTHEVSIRADMDDAARVKTLTHELGHVLLHGPDDGGSLHRGIAEVEAESVALMVAAAHGLNTEDYTVPYVSSWASSVEGKTQVEVVQSTAERVRTTALTILDQLSTQQIGDGTPPGLDRGRLNQAPPGRSVETVSRDVAEVSAP